MKRYYFFLKIKSTYILAFLCLILLFPGCRPGYQVVSMEGKYISVTATSHPNPEMVELIQKYQSRLTELTSEVIGYATTELSIGKPESPLTNFTSDGMVLLDSTYTKGLAIDFSLMNVNGHRAPIRAGKITIGDMYNTYSFENILVILRLRGKDVREVFEAYAEMGGAGISGNVHLDIKNKKIVNALIDGIPIEENKLYIIVTLDYLAEGNDGMKALTKALSVEPTGITLRDHMTNHIRRMTVKGKQIEAITDQRITIR